MYRQRNRVGIELLSVLESVEVLAVYYKRDGYLRYFSNSIKRIVIYEMELFASVIICVILLA